MELVIRARQGGKTTEALHWLRCDPGRFLVAINQRESERLKSLAPDVATRIGVPADVTRYQNYEIGIDNLDLVLRQLWGNVTLATISDDDTHD